MTDIQAQLERLASAPGEKDALAAIDDVYSKQGRWEELLRIYEDNALRAGGAPAAPLWRRAAQICWHELSSGPRAEHYFKRALESTPGDTEAMRALRQLYMARGDYDEAAVMFEKELARTDDAAEKAAGLVELAKLYGEQLGRQEKSLGALRQAQRVYPNNPESYRLAASIYEQQGRLELSQGALLKELEVGGPNSDVLARLALLAERFLERPRLHERARVVAQAIMEHQPNDQVADRVQRELESFTTDWVSKVAELSSKARYYEANDKGQAADLWISVAEIQMVYGEQQESALASVDKAFAARPGHPVALRLLEDIYGADDRFEELSLKLEMMAAYTREPEVAIELYLKAAMHHAVRLDNPEAASRIYQRVLQLQPGNKVASNALAEYYRERAQWDSALEVLSQWAERSTQATDKVAAHYACCRILDEEIGDKARARPHYEAILALDPENQAAARALEAVYREASEFGALAKVLKAKLTGITGDDRLTVLAELGDLYAGPLSDAAQALDVLGELYQVQPKAALRERLEELAARSNGFAKLVQILEGGLDRIDSDGDKIQALHSLAALYEGARDAPLEALRIHRRILSMDANDDRARSAVDRLLEAAAASGDKVAIYQEQADAATSPQERISLLHRLATELVETSKDYVRAIDVYREILKADAGDVQAIDGLLALYRRDNRWAEVADILVHKVQRLPAGVLRVPVLVELAGIYENHLSQVDAAVDAYCQVLDIEANRPEAVQGLERMIPRTKKVAMVAERLQPLYAAGSEWDGVARMLEIRAFQGTAPDGRAAMLLELGRVYEERLSRPADALGAYLRALQADPTHGDLAQALERVASQVGDFTGVFRAYRSAVSVLEGEARLAMTLRAGALATQHGDPAGAVLDFLKAVGAAETPSGLAELKGLVQAGVPFERIAEAAEQVALTMEEPQLTRYWRQLARFYEQDMNQPNEAINAWKQVLQTHHGDEQATEELDRLFDSVAEPTELVRHLREKLAAASDDGTRAALGGQIAEVLVDKVGDLAGAVAELQQVSTLTPGQRLVWRRLAELHERLSQPQEAATAMHREINLMADGPERHERLVQYSAVLAKQLGDVGNALTALQGVLTPQPGHSDAIALLEELQAAATGTEHAVTIASMMLASYKAAERWQDAVQMLVAQADASSESQARVDLLKESASLRADKLNDLLGAYADLERAFRDMPLDNALRLSLENMAGRANAWEALAAAYQAALAAIEDPQAQLPLRRKLADVLDKHLGRGEEAIEHYKAAGGGSLPDDLESLEAMERLLRSQNQIAELCEVLSAMAQKVPAGETDRRAKLLLELGQLLEEHLADKPRAVDVYRSLADLQPQNVDAWRQLERLLAEIGQPADLVPVLDKLIELGNQNPALLDDYVKRARIAVQMGQHDEAFASYRGVLLKRREHPDAIAGLEELIAVAENKLEIAQLLEPIYTGKQDHEKLAWVLGQRLAGTEELAQRKGLIRRIGDIYENRLQQKERAFGMARRSLGEDPSDMGVRMWIEKLAGETGAFRELADAYVEEAQKSAEDSKLSLQFHRRAAAILHEKLSDTAGAVGEFEAILALEPRDEKALTGLESIFRTNESHAELVGVLQRRLGMTAGLERKREYLTEIAALQAQQLGELQAAVDTYRQILELTPDDLGALEQVEQLLANMGQWEELNTFYQQEIERLASKRGRDAVVRRLSLMHRRARVIEEQFGDVEQAALVFRTVLDEEPQHADTLAYLEQRGTQGSMAAIELLEDVYKKQGDWKKYVELLENKLTQTAETEKRRVVYLEISNAYDGQLKVSDMAFLALTRAFDENRADVELLEMLEAMSERYGNWEELVEVLGTDIDAMADTELRQRLLRKLGEVCGLKLKNVEKAVGYFQQALQYDPTDELALDALDSLLEQNQMWAALADVLEKRIELAAEPKQKSALLERLAQVWGDRLMDAEAALRCHQQILEIDPDHPLTLKSMQKLYAEVQDWDALAKNLQRQEEVLTDQEDQIRIHAAAGELYTEELTDNNLAIHHWLKVVELVPSHPTANQALDVLLSAEERWEDLAVHYRRQLTFTHDVNAKSEINRRLGVILGEKLGRTDDALTSWLEVLQVEPKNVDALRALLHLYSERAMWEDFVGIARRLIPLADPKEAKDARFQLAKALGENLGRKDEAVKLAREVRATEPHTAEELIRLGQMLVNIEAFDEAVIAFEKGAPLEEEDDIAVQRYYEAAALYRDTLGKPNDARSCYECILEIKPEDAEAFSVLGEIYRNTEEWRKLVGLNEAFIPHADPATRLQILTEIRDVQDEKLGEKELAFIAGCRVYKENPSELSAADALERIAKETEGGEELVAVLEDEIDNIVDPEVKIATYRRIARIYATVLDDVPAAEEALNRILAIEPGDLEALDQLGDLGAKSERYDKQIGALEQKLGYVGEDTARKAILLEMARIWEDRIGEIDEAISALQRILEIDGGDMSALDSLARIFEQEERYTELAHTLTRKVELSQDPQENVQLRMKVAGLCESELGDPEAALQWYRGVLDFEPGYPSALTAMERLYINLERWSELIQVFEIQLGQAADSEAKVQLLSKMAAIYESEFESLKDAAATFERVLEVDSTHIPSIRNLERLLRATESWNRLIEVLEHHVSLLTENEEVTEVLLQIGEIYYRELSRVDKAEQMYNRARELNPESEAALHALGQLYERSGNWFQSLEMLQKEADSLGSDPKALPVLLRLGRINEEMLMDMGAAENAYKRALEIDPTYGPALAALKDISRNNEDWEAYSEYLITEAETADDEEEKTELFMEAAKFFLDVRDEEDTAIRYYTRALEVTPEQLDAARELAEIYFRNEQWADAGELYVQVLDSLDKAHDAKDYCQKSHRLGYINEKLGNTEASLDFYRKAFEADATYLPALEGLAQALLNTEQWEEAQKVFQTILIHHRDSLTESEIVDVQWQLGDICLKQDQPDRAYKQFEKCLEVDPDHAPSLEALAGLEQKMGNWEGAYNRMSRLAEVVPGLERSRVLLEMSTLAETQLADLSRSIEALERARRGGQPSIEALEKLGQLYLKGNQPQKACEAFEQAVTLPADPEKLSDVNFQLALVYETAIKNEPLAVEKFNAALDASPKNVQAFEHIERLLVNRQEWALLEANYRAMIARAKELTPAFRLVLWRNLAELYRQAMRNVDSAIMAYEVIQKLDPGKPEDSAILAELYAQKPDRRKEAIDMAHGLLEKVENPVGPVRNLRKLYHAERDFDAVYALCQALVYLNAADEEEKKVFQYLQQGVPARASGLLTEESWQALIHPGLKSPLSALCDALYRSAADFVTVPAKDLGLKKKEHIDVRSSDLYFARMADYVGKMLNVRGFDLYRKGGSIEPLHIVNSQPPALVAGENSEAFRDSSSRVVLYHVGRNIAYLRPDMFLVRVHPGEELRHLLLGLCLVYNRSLQHNGDPRIVENWAEHFAGMPPATLKRLQNLAKDAYSLLLEPKPLQSYAAAVEITVSRAGLLAAGDLGAAMRGVSEGGEGASAMPVRERVKELVLFSVSRPYLQLRKAIGLALVEQQQAAQ